MNKAEAKKRIEKLRELINAQRYKYHVLDTQDISDAAHDALKHELYQLEQQFPDLITPDSPTQRVGGQALDKFAKVTHSRRMLSLEDIFSHDELLDWEKRLLKLQAKAKLDYFVELKIDGFALSLIYRDGLLTTAATRGDGTTGEEVTNNIKTIEAIPLSLEKEKKGTVEIRGEVYLDKKEFERINKEQIKKDEKVFANPRNLAAGTIRQLDPKLVAQRKLSFFAYEIITDLGQQSKEDEMKLLREFGFKTVKWNKYCPDLKCVETFYQDWIDKREKQEFLIDGLVVKVNDNQLRESFGVVGKAPRGMVAYKFPAEQATTIVKQVDFNVGRTGVLTPLATFKPVPIAGTVVQHATLHNMDEIQRLGVKIGDTVVIEKAGDIIPKVIQVIKDLRTGKEKEIKAPTKCPICGSPVVKKKEGEVAIYCSNPKCFALEKENIVHFVSKGAFDIDGLGYKIVEQLVSEGLVKKPADIFKLRKEELQELERFAEKSAENTIKSINDARKVTLARLIYSLGIRHVGEETSIALANHFKSIDKIKKAGLEELQSVEDIGEVVAQSIHEFFQDQTNLRNLDELLEEITVEAPKKIKQTLAGQNIVVTGTLEKFSRDEIKETIRQLGGSISSSVSKKTSFVLAGEEAGSKLDKARELGVRVVSEKEFLDIIKE